MLAVVAAAALGSWIATDTILGQNTSSRLGGRIAVSADMTCLVSYNIDPYYQVDSYNALHGVIEQWNGSAYIAVGGHSTLHIDSSTLHTLHAGVAISGDCTLIAISNGRDSVNVYTLSSTNDLILIVTSAPDVSTNQFGRSLAFGMYGLDTYSGLVGYTVGHRALLVGSPDEDGTGDDDDIADHGTVALYTGAYGASDWAIQSSKSGTDVLTGIREFGTDVQYAWGVEDQLKFVASGMNSAGTQAQAVVVISNDSGDTLTVLTMFGTVCDSDADGVPVSISADGYWIALGCPAGNEATSVYGHVIVYKFDGDATYTVNNTFLGSADAEKFGSSVHINGNYLAVGTRGTGTGTVDYVQTFERTGATWAFREGDAATATVRGPALSSTTNAYNIQAKISADGNTLVVGVPGYSSGDADEFGTGKIVRYTWSLATTSAPVTSSSSSSDKHSDAVLGGAIGGAIGGTILLGALGYYVYTSVYTKPQTYSVMLGRGSLNDDV